MEAVIKNFINKHSQWIDQDEWADVYTALYEEFDPEFGTGGEIIGMFTNYMIEAGINPLERPDLTYVPEYFACGLWLDKVEFPSHIVSINNGAYRESEGYTELKIPGHIDCINSNAFRECSAYKVEIEEGCVIIGAGAFADCANLEEIIIPRSCSFMHDNIFWESDNVTIKCYRGSRAESYAKEYDIPLEYLD